MSFKPDQSNYLAHFTSAAPKAKQTAAYDFWQKSAYDKLVNILTTKKIHASVMPWTGSHAVCFTECPWTSLVQHTTQYSPFGIGFSKNFIFSRNGAPVYYVRMDQYKKQQWHEHLHSFVTPFLPAYSPGTLVDKLKKESAETGRPKEVKTVDYTHEREWRVPHDLTFEYNQIEFIILDTYKDMAIFPENLKDQIGRDKFLLMDNYKTIERLWPVHNLGLV